MCNTFFVVSQETERYKYAIEYACHGFEASLQMLVKILSNRPTTVPPNTGTNQGTIADTIKSSPPKKGINTSIKQPTTSSAAKEDLKAEEVVAR